jgi:hypothetical protein
MKLSPGKFDRILATGQETEPVPSQASSSIDEFGVVSMPMPPRGRYASMDEAVLALRKAVAETIKSTGPNG